MEVTFMEEEESKHINKTLNDLTVKIDEKIDELSKSIEKTLGVKQEYAEGKISENPLAYMAGAFVGGVIVGYVFGKGKC
jgi:F0F1-type ATP synthase assembly protein I